MIGRLPVGVLPEDIITEAERINLVRALKTLKFRPSGATAAGKNVAVLGQSFADSTSLHDYLVAGQDDDFDQLTAGLVDRVVAMFEGFGFTVAPLVDGVTLLPYHSGLCSEISVAADALAADCEHAAALHCDDLLRHGWTKPDFRIPEALEGMVYNQFSVCIELEESGDRPDDLLIYEQQYSREMEPHFFGKGGRFYDAGKLLGCRSHRYTPELRKCYIYSTLNFHDRSSTTTSTNFSLFFIYVPGSNTLYYYN